MFMRQHIDLAILPLIKPVPWFEEFLINIAPALMRVKVHRLDWVESKLSSQTTNTPNLSKTLIGNDTSHPGEASSQLNNFLPYLYFARNAVTLRRYDACIIPVDFDSLAWTRQALAAIPRGPFIPLIGVLNNLKAASMQDLIELGLADYIRLPLCTEEFRARVLTAITRMPRSTSLRESDGQAPYEVAPVQTIREVRKLTPRNLRSMGFKDAKQAIIDKFECDYLSDSLVRHEGNIAMAARAARKHRRAFWELMRKHGITAEPYKPELDYE